MGKVKRVLIYRLGSLGDTVVALPSLHLVARAFQCEDLWEDGSVVRLSPTLVYDNSPSMPQFGRCRDIIIVDVRLAH